MLYSITQIAEKLGVTIHTLRYYERMGLCTKAKRKHNGHRIYSDLDATRISLILILREIGLSLETIRDYVCLLDSPRGQTQRKKELIAAYKQQTDAKIQFLHTISDLLADKLDYYNRSNPACGDLEHTRQALERRFSE